MIAARGRARECIIVSSASPFFLSTTSFFRPCVAFVHSNVFVMPYKTYLCTVNAMLLNKVDFVSNEFCL